MHMNIVGRILLMIKEINDWFMFYRVLWSYDAHREFGGYERSYEVLEAIAESFLSALKTSQAHYIPLTNRVRGPYCKLRPAFFTRVRNLQYGPRKRVQ